MAIELDNFGKIECNFLLEFSNNAEMVRKKIVILPSLTSPANGGDGFPQLGSNAVIFNIPLRNLIRIFYTEYIGAKATLRGNCSNRLLCWNIVCQNMSSAQYI